MREAGHVLLASVLAAAVARGFHALSPFYRDWRIPFGVGMSHVPAAELAFYAWYGLLGLAFTLAAARALAALPWLSARRAFTAALERPLPRAALLVALFAALLLARACVLLDAPITDDEYTYRFIAQTLREGRVTNPPQPDPQFLMNQFVVCDDRGWYGKYPIAHPLFLALGQALGVERAVVPLITVACAALAWSVGAACLPSRAAALGLAFLCLSPQFLLTGATDLSQPTEMLCMLAGVHALFRHEATRAPLWAQAAGLALGLGVVVRPMPGVLFLLVGFAWLIRTARASPGRETAATVALAAFPALLCALAFLAVNALQTGSPFSTGYHVLHHGLGFFPDETVEGGTTAGIIAGSVGGGFLRQAFWLAGFPLWLVLLPLARRRGRARLLLLFIAAEYAYRVLVPKTVVAVTGPIYLAEIVPLLALLVASGLHRARAWCRLHRVRLPLGHVRALLTASYLSAALMFWPVQARSIRRSGEATRVCAQLLSQAHAARAVVFANQLTDLAGQDSWAVFCPNPSPRLDDPVIYLRWPIDAPLRDRAVQLWHERFPDRPAFCFRWVDHRAILKPVTRPDDLKL